MAVELEAKVLAPDDFDMGHQMHAPSGTTIEVLPSRQLDAVYYDTKDLILARWGVTLRHREGESGPSWTLKLPQDESGPRLARHEVRADGEAEVVPDELHDLVRGLIGAEPLRAVIRLRTTRLPLLLRTETGATLLEIADDRVQVNDDATAMFREIEVEAKTDSVEATDALAAVTDSLVKAGCSAERPLPKLIRALGPAATAPPPMMVPTVDRQSSTRELIHHAIASCVEQMVRRDPGCRLGADPEDLHRFRVAARRLRSDLQTFSPFLDHEHTTRLREELHWLGLSIGTARDLDVLAARLRSRSASLPGVDAPAASLLIGRFDEERGNAHEVMLAALRSPRYEALLEDLVAAAAAPPIAANAAQRADQRASKDAAKLVRRRWRRLRHTVDELDSPPTDDDLHRVRILAKRCRYVTEAFVPVRGRRAVRFARAMEAVQTVLGDLHDTVIAEQQLRAAADDEAACGVVAGELIDTERREREQLRHEWNKTWQRSSRKQLHDWFT